MEIIFVEGLSSDLMMEVATALSDTFTISQMSSEDALSLTSESVSERKFYVMAKFEGVVFSHLRSLKVTIFGPQLILDQYHNNRSCPRSPVPVFSTAMREMTVCLTGIDKMQREFLRDRILMMSGFVTGGLTEGVNVLIAGGVSSLKYIVAAERNIQIMKPEWVNALWEYSSTRRTIDPWDNELMSLRLPILFGLSISVTGLSAEERKEVSILVEKHGATYMPELKPGLCTHLIASCAKGQKYLYAIKWKIPVVSQHWLVDSIEKGYAQKVDSYILPHCESFADSSTPKSEFNNRPISICSNTSLINASKVGETILVCDDEADYPVLFFSKCFIAFNCSDDTFIKTWTSSIRKHGGEVVPITHDTITHIIVIEPLMQVKDDCKCVSFEWITKCFDSNTLVNESPFIVPTSTSCKPAEYEWDTLESFHYEIFTGIFHDLSFMFHESFKSKYHESMTLLINNNGGAIVPKESENTFLVTSCKLLLQPLCKCKALVTSFYINKCVEESRILPPESDFLFSPVILTDSLKQSLINCVISFCGYAKEERDILKKICKNLGATVQSAMTRRAVPKKNLLATTHLIISTVDNQKYRSALTWRIPAVTREWIGECVKRGSKVATTDYFLEGDQNMTMQSMYSESNLNETCLSMTSIPPGVVVKTIKRNPGSYTIQECADRTLEVDPNTTLQSNTDFIKQCSVSSTDATQPMINKHLQIKNYSSTPTKGGADMSFGNLDSPINTMSGLDRVQEVDMDNLRFILKTPDYYDKSKVGPSLNTPDFERALKARMEMLNVQENISMDFADFSFSENNAPMTLPLNSMVVYLSKSVGNASQMSLIEKIEKLGGSRTWVYDPKTVTHVICNIGSISDRNREELETAVKDGKKLVTTEWLNQCFNEFKHVDEEAYDVDIFMKEKESRKRKLSSETKENELNEDIREGTGWKFRKSNDPDCSMAQNVEEEETQLGFEEGPPGEKKVIMLSNIEKEERQKYIWLVERLGGQVLDSEGNMGTISHLVCSGPSKGDKYLAAVAAGKWIVHKSYLDAVERAGVWVNELDFEFGGPRTLDFLKNSSSSNTKASSQDVTMAAAALRWRESGGGAFKQWRVGILESEQRIERLGNVIVCGGGVVVPVKEGLTPDQVTHLLINKKKVAQCPVDLRLFTCYKVELIQFLLTARSLSETKKYTKKLTVTPEELSEMMKESTEPQVTKRPIRSSRLSRV